LEKDNEFLKKDNEMLKKDNEMLKKDNEMLKKDNEMLKKDNISLHQKLKNLTDKDIILKTIFTIQDLNERYQLEKHLKNNKINLLRKQRNNTCHYLCDTDDDFIQFKKNELIIQNLSSLDNDIVMKIENRYGVNVINNILQFMEPIISVETQNINNLSQEEIDDKILEFWEF
jgi:hypothetical protein